MTLQFNISALASTLAEGGSYSFTLTPKGALVGSVDIRWVIVPKGKVPITDNDFIENDLPAFDGTESFAAGATAAQTVTITPTDDAVAEVSGEFEIQIYQVVSGGNDILIDSQDVVLNDDDDFSSVPVNTLSGNGNVNNFFFGSSNPLDAEGLAGDDVYVISRYQTGAVDLSDGFDNNILKFDYGVEISSARAVSRGSSGELLLGTDASSPTATVTWNAPTGSKWKYQIADGAVLTWSQFLTALGPTTGTALTNAYTVDSLASDSVTGGNIASLFSGSGADEVFSFGGDGVIDAEGLAGDDVYIISRYQTGAVDLSDGFGANILKLDYGVEISSARAVSRGSSGELLLGTDASSPTATVTWNAPTGIKWKYQIADGDVLSWSQFLAALGPTTGTALTNAYTVEDPPGKIITSDAAGTALPENTEVTTSTAVYTAAGASDSGAIVWTLKGDGSTDDAALFDISNSGVVTFKAATTPNHEAKSSYSFTIIATAGTKTDELLVTIAVTDLNDTIPMFTSDPTATIAEGTEVSITTPVYTATATPDVAGDMIAWSLSGDDAGLFNIDPLTGKVTFKIATTPDYESGKTSYRFNVIATVGTGSTAQTATQEVILSVPNVNDAPIISTNAGAAISLTVLEDTSIQTPIAKIVASDADGDTLSYSLSGADAADFRINANGVLKFAASPSFASPADSDTDNIYNITVTVSDGTGAGALSDTIDLTINVLTASGATAPTINSDATATFAENTEIDTSTPLYTATTTGSASAAISWSLKPSGTAASYTTTAFGASLTFTAITPGGDGNDFNIAFVNTGDTNRLIVSSITYDESTKTLTITHGNNALMGDLITAFDGLSGIIPELFSLTTAGPTTRALRLFSDGELSGGSWADDAGLFNIDPFTGEVTFRTPTTSDFESGKTSYSFTIVATVGSLSTEQAVAISVTDAEDPPVLAGDLSGEVKEAGKELGEGAKFFNAHGLIFTFKDIGDVTDNFEKATLGKIRDGSLKNFQFLDVNFSSSYSSTPGSDWIFRININDFTHTYTGLVNYIASYGDFYTLSFATGITGTDALPNNWRNKISIVLASSGGAADTPGTPMVTGQLSVTDEDADDGDGFAAVNLQGRADSDSVWETATSSGKGLKIIGTYGALYLKSDGSWSYELDNDDADTQALDPSESVPETFELRVTDGSDPSETKILTITVQGTNDAVLSASASGVATTDGVGAVSVAEDTQTGNVTTITVTNEDGTPLTYSLLGDDRNLFTFDEATGILRFTEIPDFEFPTDNGKDNTYNVTVHITDGVFSEDIVLAITVTDVGTLTNPAITSGASGSIKENLQYTTQDSIYVAEGNSGSHERIAWSLKGDDAALFDIGQFTGEVTFKTATILDYESDPFIGSTANDGTPEFRFTIVGTVGSGAVAQSVEKNIIIKLEDLNDAPEITTNSGNALALSVAENTASTTILTTIAVSDADNDNISFGLSGADASLFAINAAGELTFKTAPDFEARGSDAGSNSYVVVVTATDDGTDTLTDTLAVTITVTNVNDSPPIILSPVSTSAVLPKLATDVTKLDTTQIVYKAVGAPDVAGDAIVWSLKGNGSTDDAELFTIDPNTGVISFASASAEQKKNYSFTIIATVDGGKASETSVEKTITLTINDAPIFAAGAALSLSHAEGESAVTSLVVSDINVDSSASSDTLVFALSGADAALFDIAGDGALSFKSAPDFETPADADKDNVYEVTVTVTDGFYDASGDASDADVRFFKYTGGALSKTTDSDGDRLIDVASGTITKADGTTINFAAATGLEALANSYIIVDDGDNDSTYEARLVTALPESDDFYVLGETEIETVVDIYASLTFAGIVITAKQVGSGPNGITFIVRGGAAPAGQVRIHKLADGEFAIDYGRSSTTLQTIINAVNSDSDTASLFTASLADGASASHTFSFSLHPTYTLSGGGSRTGDFITYDPYKDEIDVTISVTDVNEVSVITTNNGNALAIDVPEDTTAVTDIAATADAGDTLAFSLSGADAALFGIDASGALSFNSAPDYGDPKDAGKDNDYEVTVHVSDGVTYDASGDASDADTRVFKYSGGALSKSSNSAGNKLIDVASGTITKADGTTINFAAATGLEVLAASYIIVDDGDDNGTYEARLVAVLPSGDDFYVLGETELIDTHASVTISGIVLTAKQAGSAGNAGSIIIFKGGTLGVGVLNDGTPFLRYIDGTTTIQQVIAEINASSATSAFIASVADGAFGRSLFTGSAKIHRLSGGDTLVGELVTYDPYSDEIDVTVTITNVNDDMVTVTSDETGAALVENREVDTDTEVYTADGASDAGAIVWSLKGDGSTDDAGLFDIDSGTGVVTFKAATAPDFEAKPSYAFSVLATVGTLETEKAVTIAVTDVNEAPIITTNNGNALAVSIAEATTAVTDIAATADAGDTLAFSLSGADAALFDIDASGALSFISAPDFDSPADVGGNNVYDVTVHVTDNIYDASGNPSDADVRVFKYTGGAVSKTIDGDGDRLVSVAVGTITTSDGTAINFAAATGLEVSATSYIIVDDGDDDNSYEVRLVEALPAGDDFYVLGKTEIETIVEGLVHTIGEFTIYDPYSDEIDIAVTITDVV